MRTKKFVSSLVILSLLGSILFFSPLHVVAASSIPEGTYRIMAKCGKFVDIKEGSYNNGAITHLWQYADVDNQKFYIENNGDGSYKIIPMHSNKPLEVRNSSYDDCAEIAQWDFVDGYDCKSWYFNVRDDGYYNIVNKNSGKYMDVCGNGTENGTQIFQYEGNNTDAQLFALIPTNIKVIQGPLIYNIDYVLPKKQVFHLAHQHKVGEWFCFLVNDTSGTMYFVSGRTCGKCGEVVSYVPWELPN